MQHLHMKLSVGKLSKLRAHAFLKLATGLETTMSHL
jgi:hypothetical protein